MNYWINIGGTKMLCKILHASSDGTGAVQLESGTIFKLKSLEGLTPLKKGELRANSDPA